MFSSGNGTRYVSDRNRAIRDYTETLGPQQAIAIVRPRLDRLSFLGSDQSARATLALRIICVHLRESAAKFRFKQPLQTLNGRRWTQMNLARRSRNQTMCSHRRERRR